MSLFLYPLFPAWNKSHISKQGISGWGKILQGLLVNNWSVQAFKNVDICIYVQQKGKRVNVNTPSSFLVPQLGIHLLAWRISWQAWRITSIRLSWKKLQSPKLKEKKNEYTLATRIFFIDAKLYSLHFTIPVALAMVTRIKKGMKAPSCP